MARRDATRSRLYAAEDGAAWPVVARRTFAVPNEAQAWLRRIVKRKAVARRFPPWQAKFIARRLTVRRDARVKGAFARKWDSVIVVGGSQATAHLLLHELAHLFTPVQMPAHGREFRRAYLTLVRYGLGAESARALRAAFKAAGLPYRPYRPRPGQRPPLAPRVTAFLDSGHNAVPTLS